MDKLLLNSLLGFSKEEIQKARIKLNVYNGSVSPLEIFKNNPNDILTWNYWNNKHYEIGQISICLVRLRGDRWLLCHIGHIDGIIDIPKDTGVGYTFTEDERYKSLYGRVIVKYHNSSRTIFRKASSIINDIEVTEILPSMYTGFDFPGYENVNITWNELFSVINGNYPSYQNALRQQKAVYLLTDTNTGKLYVGSATSNSGMLLARWSAYASNGHGGNFALRELVKEKGFDYIKKYFTYTILENYNQSIADNFILARESYWKKVLCSREFGYNKN